MGIPMGITMGIPVGMGWVWGLKCHPHGSPAELRWLRRAIAVPAVARKNKNKNSSNIRCTGLPP